ncbi:hypothetical protein [Amycolatopsis suaedae]|uniref:DUF3558 domain-containing protein n=1 Tax=Amycolatopsis suaedae TaxID=2510978 RepID=A0A4Q7J8X5_9PSEU|nr:hypothetical protein [Amycolatopsis suaedae]RZQ63448.1 hypothetical protein EWH70_13510 [Amycolatopsis suaedae]
MRFAMAGLALFLLLTGCSTVGGERAEIGEPMIRGEVPIPAAPGAVVPASQWPDACSLLSTGDISAVLLGATDVEQTPRQVRPRSFPEFAADQAWTDQTTAAAGECLFRFRLPGETNANSTLWIRVAAVGDPALVEKYFEFTRIAPNVPPGRHCDANETEVWEATCRQGPLMFRLGGQTAVSFAKNDGPATSAFWREEVLSRFAAAAAGKVR